jgi:hypothetical protein
MESLFDLNQRKRAISGLHAKATRVELLLERNNEELQRLKVVSDALIENNRELGILVPELAIFGKTRAQLEVIQTEIDDKIAQVCRDLKEFSPRPVSPQPVSPQNLSALSADSNPWPSDSVRGLTHTINHDTMATDSMSPIQMTQINQAFRQGGHLSIPTTGQVPKISWAEIAGSLTS